MKSHLNLVPAAVVVLCAALAAVAQQDDAARQRWQKWREAQNKAIQAIQSDAVMLRAGFEEAGKAMPSAERWASMSEEERIKLREAGKVRWEEQQGILADIEQQIAVLKGSRRLRLEHDEAIGELVAIRDLAREEKAQKAAERIQGLIDRRQATYDRIVQKIGVGQ